MTALGMVVVIALMMYTICLVQPAECSQVLLTSESSAHTIVYTRRGGAQEENSIVGRLDSGGLNSLSNPSVGETDIALPNRCFGSILTTEESKDADYWDYVSQQAIHIAMQR